MERLRYILFSLVLSASAALSLVAEELPEVQSERQISASLITLTDKSCYLTGERLHVSLCSCGEDKSKIAYVEIADSEHLFAQAMVELESGRGWADIALPASMHSGNYTLTAYTRQMLAVNQQPNSQIVSVVNVGHVTRADQITFVKPDSLARPVAYRTYAPGESFETEIPLEAQNARLVSMSLSRWDMQTSDYAVSSSFVLPKSVLPLEYEGHVAVARVVGNHDVVQGYLSRVGKVVNLFEGQELADGRWTFYTKGLNGRMPTSLTAVNLEGNTVPLEFVSPYAKLLPQQKLPELTVSCTEEQLRERSLSAQREELFTQQSKADTSAYSRLFMGDEPTKFYDLDEWRRFSSVREIIIEFLSAVHSRREKGVNYLFIYDNELKQVSRQPALVLIDGMPVYDIDRFLKYDARLLKYVQIYDRNYAFGNLLYHGVISFISIKGLLSNYKLEAGTQLVNYDFPQLCPDFVSIPQNASGTLYWNPDVKTKSLSLTTPKQPGLYLVNWKWVDADGRVSGQKGYFEVR